MDNDFQKLNKKHVILLIGYGVDKQQCTRFYVFEYQLYH